MKAYLLLLLLIPLCSAEQFYIECYGQDFLMVNNQLLQCTGKVQQACYTRGESFRTGVCSKSVWTY
uniref:Uncharacterized protein n=1 Tax=Haplochromis burtoni TaxID=8153 RepID=A0A3Q2W7Z3_HAPBU